MIDNVLFRKLTVEKAEIESIVNKRLKLISLIDEYESCVNFSAIADESLAMLIKEEISMLEPKIDQLANEILNDISKCQSSNCTVNIIADAGSEIYASELLSAYEKYIENLRYESVIDSENKCEKGLKSASITVIGEFAYSLFINEEGIHKFTDKAKTYFVKVLVFPYGDNAYIEPQKKDIRIDLFHSSGAGGQNVNKVESAVRLTHIPTGIVVTSMDERSQLMNKDKAYKELNVRLKNYYKSIADKELESIKKSKQSKLKIIRVYDKTSEIFTDDRLNKKYDIDTFINGKLLDLHKLLNAKGKN